MNLGRKFSLDELFLSLGITRLSISAVRMSLINIISLTTKTCDSQAVNYKSVWYPNLRVNRFSYNSYIKLITRNWSVDGRPFIFLPWLLQKSPKEKNCAFSKLCEKFGCCWKFHFELGDSWIGNGRDEFSPIIIM